MSALPTGWRRESLAQLDVEAKSGFASGKHASTGELLHLRPMNITGRGHLSLEQAKFVAAEAGSSRVQRGDVLFNNTNSPVLIGKTAYVGIDGSLGFSNHMTRLRVRDGLEARYLALHLQWQQESGYFESICSNHVNQASVSAKRLLQVEIALPSPPEQRRIVDILEDHLSRLDAAERSLRSARQRVPGVCASLLAQNLSAVGPPTRLSELLAERMRNGHSARASADGRGVRTLTLTAVTRGDFSEANTKLTSADPGRVQDLWLTAGDILVQRANTPELVGTTALYNGHAEWAIFPDLLIRVRVDRARALPEYVAMAMQTERSHRTLRNRAKGLAGTMPKIDQAAIAELEIPIPDLAVQHEIVQRGEQSRAESQRLSEALQASLTRSAHLRRALLAAAFSGKLTGAASDVDRVEELVDSGAR